MKITKHIVILVLVLFSLFTIFMLLPNSSQRNYIVLAIIICYLLILYIGVTRYRLNYFSNAIHKGKTKGIALTFDDGPNKEFTPKVLEILAKHQVTATFFVIGTNIKGNEKLLQSIDKAGHIIGNHSFTHVKWFNVLPPKKILADIQRCNQAIEQVIGKKINYFRTPFGLTSPRTAIALKNSNLTAIGWDFRSFDTMAKTEVKLLEKLKRKANQSSIILLHDNNSITVNVLDSFLTFCKENGIKIVSLNEMIDLPPYKKD